MSLKALVYKVIIWGLLAAIVLPALTDLGFTNSFLFGAGLGVVLFALWDWLILNYFGNAVCTIVDAATAAVAVRYYGVWLLPEANVTWGDAVIYGVLVGVAEYFFHNYLNRTEVAKSGTNKKTE